MLDEIRVMGYEVQHSDNPITIENLALSFFKKRI